MGNRRSSMLVGAALAVGCGMMANAGAADDSAARDAQLQRLEAEVQALRREVQQEKAAQAQSAVPPVTGTVVDDDWNASAFHLAGYAVADYIDTANETGSFAAAFTPVVLFQYRDLVLLDAALEVEVGEDGTTETNLEYANVNFFINDYLTLSGGKFLNPLGQFVQNLHPAWINKLASPPPGYGHDGAAPEADVGFQLRGGVPIGARRLNYVLYVANGPELEAEDGALHGVVADGFARDEDGRKVWGGRVGFLPWPSLEVGLSGATGRASVTANDGAELTGDPSHNYEVFGADVAYVWRTVDMRGEYIRQKVGDAAASVAPDGGEWAAWYVQASRKFARDRLEGVLRYGDTSSPQAAQEQSQWAFGLNYLFSPSALVKLAYEINDNSTGAVTDENRWLVQFTYAY